MLYLFLFKRTAKIEVKKFNSRRAVPVVVLNKQSLRGDNDGCCNTIRTSSLKNKRTPKKMLYKNSCQIASELKTNKSHKHLFTSSHNCQKTRAIQHFNNTESSHSCQNNKTKKLIIHLCHVMAQEPLAVKKITCLVHNTACLYSNQKS